MTRVRRIALTGVTLVAALIIDSRQPSAASLAPFNATVVETQTVARCTPVPNLCITIVGSGHATHLGRLQESAFVKETIASPAGPGCLIETRVTTLTAANGDLLRMHAIGRSCTTGPTTVTAVDYYQVMGGTGRFKGATGGGTDTAIINVAGKTAVATFSGVLSTVGPLH